MVTGSSRGIGRAIALRMARDGWTVAVHFSSHERRGREVEKLLGSACKGVYQADLSQPGAASQLFQAALADGPVEALVNNAGVYLPMSILEESDAKFAANLHKTFAINFEASALLTRAAARHFVTKGGGKICNVASRVGFKGEASASLYAASKAALANLTRSLAVELAPNNIQVFGIAPGWVDTAMVRDGMESRLPEILATIPVGRMATPDDCSAAVAFLLSDEASYLSGHIIDINGASYFH
ncbi:MAG: oxidoreductase [Chthonomonas sp.]